MNIKNPFLSEACLHGLFEQERGLYKIALTKELSKINPEFTRTDKGAQLKTQNWGVFIFKPPRASTEEYFPHLLEELLRVCRKTGFFYLGTYQFSALSKNHLRAIYPGDHKMVYWPDLVKQLTTGPARLSLVQHQNVQDVADLIREIKGWFKPDHERGRLSDGTGLRNLFARQVLAKEGVDVRVEKGSLIYEDTGIHAPCSVSSRYTQTLGLMGVDPDFATWTRARLSW